MGWIANLLSVPVTTGFLAGIAVHIVVSQLPALLGVPGGGSNFVSRTTILAANLGQTNVIALSLGLGVFAVTFITEKISPRLPGALAGLVLAALLVGGCIWRTRAWPCWARPRPCCHMRAFRRWGAWMWFI